MLTAPAERLSAMVKLTRENDESMSFLVGDGTVSHPITSSRDSVERRCQGHGVRYGSAREGDWRVGDECRSRHDSNVFCGIPVSDSKIFKNSSLSPSLFFSPLLSLSLLCFLLFHTTHGGSDCVGQCGGCVLLLQ